MEAETARRQQAMQRRVRTAGGAPKPEARVDVLIEQIRESIRTGRFVPGQRLVEADLQRLADCSRSTVREAIRRLAAEGLIDTRHHRGARVRELSRAEVVHLYQVREALEGLACRLAAENIGRGDYRARFKALEAEFARDFDGSHRSFFDYNQRYHRLILGIADNPQLERLVDQCQHSAFTAVVAFVVDRPSVKRAIDEHRLVTRAILAGDAAAAEAAMRQHLRSTCAMLLERAQNRIF
jgi:DNA-binding GntR family transcriptional regulator